ncbi:MAG: aminotransferase class III-fold pyridoxal phosphate-dependent enzyme [Candidatus Geothermarchaeales archaeon]
MVATTVKYCVPSTFAYPLVIARGEGCYIEDLDGRRYLDFNSNVCSAPLGYGHPSVRTGIERIASSGAHKIAGQDFYTEEHATLAQRLVSITPKQLSKVFLSNTGTEAVENCMKFAYRKHGALPGVSCHGAFHGRTLGALTFTSSKPVHKFNFPQLPHRRIHFCTKDEDPRVDQVFEVLDNEKVAFIITECVQGEGGYNFASKRFMTNLQKASQEHGVPLIIDEVQTGLGRTGRWWAFEHYQLQPNLVSSAKAVQVGASILQEDYSPQERGAVSTTWGGGDRVALATGLAIIETIESENLMRKATSMGRVLLAALRDIKDSFPEVVADVNGLGLMLKIDFTDSTLRDEVVKTAFKKGLLLLGAGEREPFEWCLR